MCPKCTTDYDLAHAWAYGPGNAFRYRIGQPGRRIPSCWFRTSSENPTEEREVVGCSFIEREIFRFLVKQHESDPDLKVTANRIRSIRLLAKFMLLEKGEAR